ncbi:MAG: SDR family NAD(P)-dependent oxidoreductase [Pseudomonadota bacterium]
MTHEAFRLNTFSLTGRTALIAGGTDAIGQAIAIGLARAGANVTVVGRREMSGLKDPATAKNAGGIHHFQADLTKDGSCVAAVEKCLEDWGALDILVNCSGISLNVEDVTQFSRTEWDKMVAVKLTAAFDMIQASSQHMISQRYGKIINIASLYSFLGGRWSPAYASTKHGLVGLTKAMCDELAHCNIQVNAIAPGFIDTPLTDKTRNDEARNAEIIARIPAERWGLPADLMGVAVFLAATHPHTSMGQS